MSADRFRCPDCKQWVRSNKRGMLRAHLLRATDGKRQYCPEGGARSTALLVMRVRSHE